MAILKINGDTSGSVSLTVPAAAGTNTVTVPAETGTVLTTASSGVCRAWVNFNGTGTVAIRASFNVSSITDNGTGNYTINFTSAMSDANYSVNFTSTLSTDTILSNGVSTGTFSLSTSSVIVKSGRYSSGLIDQDTNLISVFR